VVTRLPPLHPWSLLLIGLFASPAALAGREDTIRRLMLEGKTETAQERCTKWEAPTNLEEPLVREACAQAYWRQAERIDSVEGWISYALTWKGTEWATTAFSREAEAALRDLPEEADEATILDMATRYAGTKIEPELRARAIDAAYRDVKSSKAAVDVVNRYPDHPGRPGLVERFPEGFFTLTVTGRAVKWQMAPAFRLPSTLEPTLTWVAREPSGRSRPWDTAATELLIAAGVRPETIAAVQPAAGGEEGPRLPICWVPGMPEGWTPGVELKVGKGTVFRPVGWDKDCGPEAWPIFLVTRGSAVAGLSTRPGRRVDVLGPEVADKATIRSHVKPLVGGEAVLEGGAIVLPAANLTWLYFPTSGGAAWVSNRGPSPAAQPLAALKGGPLSNGWRVAMEGSDLRVSSPALDRMPPALRDWRLPAGEAHVLAPFVGVMLGLSGSRAVADRSPAAELGGNGWNRTGGGLDRTPPAGASPAGIYVADPPQLEAALNVLASVGFKRAAIQVVDGWKADLDVDRVPELVVRATYEGQGIVFVLDPIEGSEILTTAGVRVFSSAAPRILPGGPGLEQPFSFRKGDYVYLAWGIRQGSGPEGLAVEVVRSDGVGFVSSATALGAP
jgi:hypothetical protein